MLWICDDCTTVYSPGAPACPHCGSAAHHDQGDETMPKTTKARGATHGGPHEDDQPEPEPETAPPPAPAAKKARAKKTADK